MKENTSFGPELWRYLRALKKNNGRDWFQANRNRYQEALLEPSIQFIADFAPRLEKVSKHFNAIPRATGGSMFRIYRDVRFSKDKSPYKTHVGIQFRHERHKDAHAPGFYLHLEPGGCFAGIGMWRPDSGSLQKIRQKIADNGRMWRRSIGGKAFREGFELGGESLKRPPRGFDPEHPLIDDIKRKSYVAVASIDQKDVTSPGFLDHYALLARAGAPLVRFLCLSLDLAF